MLVYVSYSLYPIQMTRTFQPERKVSVEQTAEILLVEDDPQDAELTIHELEECGFADRTEHVTDGDEALDYITSLTLFADPHKVKLPRLILLDMTRPTAGGLHVLRQLRSDERTKGIPIIVMTESRLAIEIVESHNLGVNSYVLKPHDRPHLTEAVAAIGNYWLSFNEPPPH